MLTLPGKSFFSPPKPAALAPLPTKEDPAIAEAKKKTRQSELRRRGRAASIVTGGQGVLGEPPLSRPGNLGG